MREPVVDDVLPAAVRRRRRARPARRPRPAPRRAGDGADGDDEERPRGAHASCVVAGRHLVILISRCPPGPRDCAHFGWSSPVSRTAVFPRLCRCKPFVNAPSAGVFTMLASSPVRAAGNGSAAPASRSQRELSRSLFCALFFSGGSADTPLVWIGGARARAGGCGDRGAALRLTPAPVLDRPAAALLLGCLFGLAVWMGVSTLWSLSPDLHLGVHEPDARLCRVCAPRRAPRGDPPRPAAHVARAAALLLGARARRGRSLAKCVPALYADYGRVARLRAPLGYWNELALLCAAAVPLALWLAAPRAYAGGSRRGRRAALRRGPHAAADVLAFRRRARRRGGRCLGPARRSDRVESLAAARGRRGRRRGVFGVALALPGSRRTGSRTSVRVHDGWIFALVVLALGARRGRGRVRARARRDAQAADGRAPPARRAHRRDPRGRGSSSPASPRASRSPDGSGTSSRIPARARSPRTHGASHERNSSNRWRWWQEAWQRVHARIRSAAPGPARSSSRTRLRRSPPIVVDEPHNTPLQLLERDGHRRLPALLRRRRRGAVGIVRARLRARAAERARRSRSVSRSPRSSSTASSTRTGTTSRRAGRCCSSRAPPRASRAGARDRARAARSSRSCALAVALAVVYSLAAPWLSDRQLAHATTIAQFKRAHTYDPLSTFDALRLGRARGRDGDLRRAARALPQDGVTRAGERQRLVRASARSTASTSVALAYDALTTLHIRPLQGPRESRAACSIRRATKVLGVWSPKCPRGSRRASTPLSCECRMPVERRDEPDARVVREPARLRVEAGLEEDHRARVVVVRRVRRRRRRGSRVLCMRAASADAAPAIAVPVQHEHARRGSAARSDARAAPRGRRPSAASRVSVRGAAAAGAACGCATGRTRCAIRVPPISASAISSAAASAPTTIVAARHGNGSGKVRRVLHGPNRFGASALAPPTITGPRRREPVVERVLRTPAELACGERDVEDAPLQLAEPRVHELRVARRLRSPRWIAS